MKFIDTIISKKIRTFGSLEKQIKSTANVSLDAERGSVLKNRIMHTVKFGKPLEAGLFETLTQKIRELASQINPREYFRFMLREKITIVADSRQQGFSFGKYRQAFASALIVLFVIGIFFDFGYNVDRASAATTTILEQVSGSVSVLRNDQEYPGKPGFLLMADDVIRTGPGSRAIIRYLDQSVSRLDENTNVKISRLYVNPSNKTETIVEVIIEQGRMWSRVVNLINDVSRFQVKAQNTVAVAHKKAAFDIKVPVSGAAQVAAIQNHVDLVVATDKKILETTLVKGFSAEVKEDTFASPKIVSQSDPQDDVWISDNLKQDKQYIENIKQEAQDKLKDQSSVLPGNPLYAVKELRSSTELALTFDGVSKEEKILAAAKEKLGNAEVFIERGDSVGALASLNDFKVQIQSVIEWIKTNEAAAPANVSVLKAELQEMLDTYQKEFTLLLPTDPLYPIKQAVSDVKLDVAENSTQKTQEKLSQASDKLLEAHDLIEKGDTTGAKLQVQEYNKAISDVVSEVKQLPTDQKEKAVAAILTTKTEDLKTLEAASVVTAQQTTQAKTFEDSSAQTNAQAVPPLAAPIVTTSQDLQKTITEAKTESLTKVGEAVLDMQLSQPSADVLRKVEDINKVDVNGKSVIDLRLTKDSILIRTDDTVIRTTSVTNATAATTTTTTTTTVTAPVTTISPTGVSTTSTSTSSTSTSSSTPTATSPSTTLTTDPSTSSSSSIILPPPTTSSETQVSPPVQP